MSSAIITVEGLGKKYRLQHQQHGQRYVALRDVITEKAKGVFEKLKFGKQKTEISNAEGHNQFPISKSLLSALPASEDFWALRNVSFEVRRGEVVGIIGRNGAGKSTLLKILSRITEPTEGRVRIKGRVASLLEVGTGFHPELTGRENVFLNGAILGMHRAEIKRKFDEIVAFAEVEKFLDTPVKRYSSGMYVRLAFAVAAHLEPEILIVDEVLAVGDAEFQKKCLGKMESVSTKEGRTVLFVSHNMQAIRNLAPQSVLLNKGQVAFCGNTKMAVEKYLGRDGGRDAWECDTSNLPRTIQGSGLVHIENVWFTAHKATFGFNEDFEIGLRLAAAESLGDVFFDITFFNLEGESAGTSFSAKAISLKAGQNGEIKLQIPNLRLAPGRYYCDVAVLKGNWLQNLTVHDVVRGILHFEILSPKTSHDTPATWHQGWGDVAINDMVVIS
jgi:lipopolysaccharide transport system ATP-binding protein